MFQGTKFTLAKFKSINSNNELLENFKTKFKTELNKIREERVKVLIHDSIKKMMMARSNHERQVYQAQIESIKLTYTLKIPHTFENLMDLFVKGLQHQQMVETLKNQMIVLKQMEVNPHSSRQDISDCCQQVAQIMADIVKLHSEQQPPIINEHNKFYFTLMERVTN